MIFFKKIKCGAEFQWRSLALFFVFKRQSDIV